MKRNYLIVGMIAMAMLSSCHHAQEVKRKAIKAPMSIKVKTTRTEAIKDSSLYNYSGIVTPLMITKLSFRQPGFVNSIYVELGDQVKKGQILAEIDKASLESSYKVAQAMQAQAQDAYDRLKKVYNKGSLPEIQWEEIKSKLEQANAAEQIAKNNLENCFLKAPSSGIIGSRNIEVGTSVMPGLTVIDLLDIRDLYVRISVPENEISKFKKEQEANIIIPAINQQEYKGSVEKIGVMANKLSKTYEVKIKVKNTSCGAKPGMACDVNIGIKNSENYRIAIPSAAIIKDTDNKTYVYVVDRKTNTVSKQAVKTGAFINNEIEIITGLKIGDIVVTSGQHKLSNQALITL